MFEEIYAQLTEEGFLQRAVGLGTLSRGRWRG
jgi:hypothetical protein